MIPSALPRDWSIYEAPHHWPTSDCGLFLARAVQRLGHLSHCDWVGEEPRWANHEPRPYIPRVISAFDDDGPVQAVHDAFAATIRSIVSPARFVAERLHQQILRRAAAQGEADEQLERQFAAAELRSALGADKEDPISPDHWAEVWWDSEEINSELDGAKRRLPAVAANLLALCQSGRLKTLARPIGGGTCVSIPAEAWEIDSEPGLLRVATCALNLAAPLEPDQPHSHWIFVDQADVDREMRDLEEAWTCNHVEQNAPMRTLTEGTLNDCATWLALQFEDPSTRHDAKQDLFEKAKKVFGGRLSERGFLAVWTAVSVDYPDRRRSGPRNKKANSPR